MESKKYIRKIRIVNLYNNKVGKRQLYEKLYQTARWAIQNIFWRLVIQKQILLVGDMNANSYIWNFHCH